MSNDTEYAESDTNQKEHPGEVRTVCEVLGHEAGEAPGQKEQMVA